MSYAVLPHVLIIDDDDRIRALLARYLSEHGFVVGEAQDAAHARAALARFVFDVLVVDVMMPGESGLGFTQSLREAGNDLPVLLLTALGETSDRIAGLQAGADDYLAKPFEPAELLLRLQAILRRRPPVLAGGKTVRIGRWTFDPVLGELSDGDRQERLTQVEANLLKALASRAGLAVSREDLASLCDLGDEASARTIDVQVTRLRRKLDDDGKAPRLLLTVRGQGYLLRTENG